MAAPSNPMYIQKNSSLISVHKGSCALTTPQYTYLYMIRRDKFGVHVYWRLPMSLT